MSAWIYLHFPRLQLDSLFTELHQSNASEEPSADITDELATIVVDTRHHHIVQMDDKAADYGISLGMGLGSASALCSALNVHPYDETIEQHQLDTIAQWLYLVTSDMVLYPPNGLLLKASHMLALYSDLHGFWQAVQHQLEHHAISYQFASGFSPYCAMLLAKQGTNLITDCREALLNRLSSQPLPASELDCKQVEQLQRVGIRDFSSLLKLPLKEVARRFNIDLVNYLGRLLGELSHPLDYFQPPERFVHSLELLYDIENTQWLLRPLTRLLKQLDDFLTLRNQVAYELCLTLHQRDHEPESITFTSGGGDSRFEKWLKLCELSLESLSLSAPVYQLTLEAVRTGQANQHYIDIFEGDKGQANRHDLIALLQAKLGTESVLSPVARADHRPERATQFVPANQQEKLQAKASNDSTIISRLRPTRLVSPPTPLQDKVELIHGPERIVSGWWDGDEVTRDYFIAQSAQGQWLWVYRTEQKLWFLHGYFS
ncbi:Y-family DNA polymerase [Vibrio sp. WXL210]|uniref:Y-family DNA polymerase n=1 Tax=Vibrio sp. WXL210 TaxID=3450709 RepID=UPI003EC6840A